MPYRKWSDDEKRLVVLELLKGGKSVGQLAKERGMSEPLIYRWRDQALKAIDGVFKGNGNKRRSDFSGERDRPRSEDKRIFPLDTELEKALKGMTGYELTWVMTKPLRT